MRTISLQSDFIFGCFTHQEESYTIEMNIEPLENLTEMPCLILAISIQIQTMKP